MENFTVWGEIRAPLNEKQNSLKLSKSRKSVRYYTCGDVVFHFLMLLTPPQS